jgi:hypothetical protein
MAVAGRRNALERYRPYAAELVALAPDVLLAAGATVRPMQQATRTIPIVFAGVSSEWDASIHLHICRRSGVRLLR